MSQEEPVLSQEILDSLRELQSPEDPDFVARLLGVFLGHVPGQLTKLEQAITAGQGKEFSKVAHSIKSSCFNIGAKRCGDLCFTLEVLGETNDVESAKKILVELKREFDVAKKEISALPEMTQSK